jgi:hypothetical protein
MSKAGSRWEYFDEGLQVRVGRLGSLEAPVGDTPTSDEIDGHSFK